MFINTKPTAVKIGRSPVFQSVREATVARGLNVSRGRAAAQVLSPPARPSAFPDRFGAAIILVLGLALVAGAMMMVAQIWANLGMIR